MAVRFDRLPDDILEDDFQQLTLDLFHTLRWDHNFTRRTRGKGGKWVTATSKKGWPDLTLWTPRFGGVLLFRELKTMKGVVSTEQTEVMADLTRAGQDACVWRPSDWDEMVAMATKGPKRNEVVMNIHVDPPPQRVIVVPDPRLPPMRR